MAVKIGRVFGAVVATLVLLVDARPALSKSKTLSGSISAAGRTARTATVAVAKTATSAVNTVLAVPATVINRVGGAVTGKKKR